MKAGIDEAGKGCVIGPLVVAGVACDCEEYLRSIGVRDSKRLSQKKREELAEKIRKVAKVEVISLSAEELNELMEIKNLNEILRDLYAEIIVRLAPSFVYVDSPDVNPERFSKYLKDRTGVEVLAEHKADEKYVLVSSASIIAKVKREEEIKKLKEEIGDFGSGYPSDPRTISFLKKQKSLLTCVRRKWGTLKKLGQTKLEDFVDS
ncbi:MAG: ribonuclease HII [Archaeoglobaceae archaeon]